MTIKARLAADGIPLLPTFLGEEINRHSDTYLCRDHEFMGYW
jgi:hypothetical protein